MTDINMEEPTINPSAHREIVQTETLSFEWLKNGRLGTKVFSNEHENFITCLLDAKLAHKKTSTGSPFVKVGMHYVCDLIQNKNSMIAVYARPLTAKVETIDHNLKIVFSNGDSIEYNSELNNELEVIKKIKTYNFYDQKKVIEEFKTEINK